MASVRIRQRVEREIAKKAIAACLEAGYNVTVFNGEDDELKNSRDAAALLAAMFTTDEDYLILNCVGANSLVPQVLGVAMLRNPSVSEGWIRFTYGNDGWDVISDYTTNLETVLAPVNAFAHSLS